MVELNDSVLNFGRYQIIGKNILYLGEKAFGLIYIIEQIVIDHLLGIRYYKR